MDSWRDLAATRGGVKTCDESHGTQHCSHGWTVRESHGVCGESSPLWHTAALLCQLFLLFITSFFKREKRKQEHWFIFSVPLLCLLLSLLCRDIGGGAGRTCFLCGCGYLAFLFPARVFLPVLVLVLRSKLSCYRCVQGGMGQDACAGRRGCRVAQDFWLIMDTSCSLGCHSHQHSLGSAPKADQAAVGHRQFLSHRWLLMWSVWSALRSVLGQLLGTPTPSQVGLPPAQTPEQLLPFAVAQLAAVAHPGCPQPLAPSPHLHHIHPSTPFQGGTSIPGKASG